MKKISTLLAIVFYVNTQGQILNPGFETWSTDAYVPSAMNPNSGNGSTGWWDYNVFNSSFVGGSPISVYRCDTAHSGTYSARIETVVYTNASWNIYKAWGVPYIGHNYSDTLGILYNGTVNETAATSSPGFPFTQTISNFNFYYQYKPNGVDTAECRVSLVKSGTLVAGGIFKTGVATGSSWQQASVTMYYLNNLTPDTMYVLFSASSLDKKPKPGSVLWIDDVDVTIPTGINQVPANKDQVIVYPNPGEGIFTIQTTAFDNTSVEVYNLLGEKILSDKLQNNNTQIDLSGLAKGMYQLRLIKNNNVIYQTRISKI